VSVTEILLKGINFRGVLLAVEREHGKATAGNVLERVSGEGGESLRTGELVAGGWYPAAYYDALLKAVEEEGLDVRALAKAAIVHDFATLMRLFSFFISPEFALKNTVKVLSRYVQGGKVEVVDARSGRVHFRFQEFYGYTPRMWQDFLGGMDAVFQLMKVKSSVVRVLRGGKAGDDHFEVLLTYEP
jgi:hypothetical protein